MNIVPPIVSISIVWFVSEILLGIFKRSHDKSASQLDKSSFRLLWITIIISLVIGIYIGFGHIGHIYSLGYLPFIIGLTLIILGMIIRWTAIITLWRYFTVNVSIGEHHRLIERGLYKYIRHPSYAGSLISFFGLAMSFANWISFLIIIIPISAAHFYRIKIEEDALIKAFGNDYIDYIRRTERLMPGIY